MRLLVLAVCASLAAISGCSSGSSGPAVCSTGSAWHHGEASGLMSPGGDCISCHSQGEGPRFAVAGTVMNASNDDEDCNGVSGVTVRLTGADGQTLDLPTNAAGNFYRGTLGIQTPYTAKVISGTKERAMATPQTSGDCASCHTSTGQNGAPGRILAPK